MAGGCTPLPAGARQAACSQPERLTSNGVLAMLWFGDAGHQPLCSLNVGGKFLNGDPPAACSIAGERVNITGSMSNKGIFVRTYKANQCYGVRPSTAA